MSLLDKTIADLEWKQVLDALAQRAKTDLGKARSLARPLLDSAGEVEAELARIEELRPLAAQGLAIPAWGVRDVRVLVDRAAKGGTLEAQELLACANVLAAMLRAKDFVAERKASLPLAWKVADRIEELDDVTRRIERSFEASGELSDRASPALQDLRDRARGLHRSIKGKLDSLLRDEAFVPKLRENYFTIRNERYVVPVVANYRNEVPGIVHNASQSGQTLFIEPEALISLGNELAIAQSMVVEEERRILQELSGLLGRHAAEIGASLAAVAELDATEAGAKLAHDLAATPPDLVGGNAPFALGGMRHPLLVLQGKHVVANDVSFSEGARVLVISGPNAGGKTVTMTGVGLCALMLRAGLPLPAEKGSSMPLFRAVYTAIGDDQDLAKDLSTFSAHLTALKQITETAGSGGLVLIDEIAADTDPREGAAIALAVLEHLIAQGARVLVTTHLEELKAVALTNPAYVNARVEFDAVKLAPTYHLRYGTPGSSSAIDIARRVGLAADICARAEENMKSATGPLGQALTALEEERAKAEQARAGLEADRKAIASMREGLERKTRELAARREELETEGRRAVLAEMERVRAEVVGLLADLQAAPTVKEAVETQELLDKVIKQESEKLKKDEARATIAHEEKVMDPIAPGMRVKILSLDREGQVLEVHGDEALVAAGALKLRQKVKDLVPLKGAAKGPTFGKSRTEKLKAAQATAAGSIDFGATRVDVRGLRAEDAVKMVETFLDRAYGEGKAGATIVHGLGSGALRASIRDYLKASPYIRSFRSAETEEGGEGATIVELKS